MDLNKFYLLLFLSTTIYTYCREKETSLLKNNEFQCVPCPDKCHLCVQGLNESILCVNCQEGYYLDQNDSCQPCSQNCSHCLGPSIDQCHQVHEGYFFENSKKQISPCLSPLYSTCDHEGKCLSCKLGNYKIEGENIDQQNQCGECKTGGLDNCLHCIQKCSLDKKEYLSCSLCEFGFNLVDEKCIPCSKSCQICENNICIQCKIGFQLVNNECIEKTIPHCLDFQINGECLHCQSNFYKYQENQCISCISKIPHCAECEFREKQLQCVFCQIGFYLTDQGTCDPCPENCTHCDKESCFCD